MSNTSDQTTKQSKTRLIVGEIGVDTETGIIGKGHSYDNGKTFVVDDTIYGRIYHKDDHGQIWRGIQDKVETVVKPAIASANSAYAKAQAAIDSAQVTSDAMSDIASATAEAKQGADNAMSRAVSAWDVATGAKEAVTDFDPLITSAQSDASKALIQIADTASALSDAKTAFSSDVAETKKLANTAQATADSAVKSAGENAKALTSQANALSDARKAMDSDIANAKGLANAAQTTADNAVKSASSVADDLTAVASQAKSNANGITKVTSDVGLLQTTVANNTGDISTIQETAKQIQQAVSDNSGAITVAKQTADSAVAVASDAKSNATVAVQTASGASVTAKNAQGDATTAMTTANSAVIQASDAKSNATVAVQTASEASLTAANAKGDASIAKQTASDASIQIKNAQGDISKLQTRAGAIETSVANNSGAIADVQATANQLKASVSDNAGNITIAKQTADSAVTVASDAKSNATVASQTASQASITAQNASGQAASAVITANGAMTTASDAKSNATVAIQTASGASLTATNAKSDATVAKQTASEAKVQASNAESDFAQLSIRAGKIEANVANNSGAIASVQQTANGLTTTVADIKANGGGRNYLRDSDKSISGFGQDLGTIPNEVLNSLAGETITVSVDVEWSDYQHSDSQQNRLGFELSVKGSDGKSYYFGAWGHPATPSGKERVSKTFTLPANVTFTVNNNGRNGLVSINGTGRVSHAKIEGGTVAHDWSPAPEDLQNQFTQTKQSIDGLTTTINDPKTGLNATYQTAAGNATTISNVKSDVYQLQTTASGLTSRVGNLESKTNTQETAIEQNKNAIALKADQTTVDKINGTVSQMQSTLTVQAGQIQEKVTSSQVTGMLTNYATQDYTQSLVTQKANDWDLNLTTLKTDVDAIKANGGGVNLVSDSEQEFTGKAYDFHYYNLASLTELTPGKTYTMSFSAKVDDKAVNCQQSIFVDIYNGSWSFSTTAGVPISTDYQRITHTFTIPEGQTGVSLITPYLSHPVINGNPDSSADKSDSAGTGYIKEFMLEEGTVAHDWSPAPSDMATVTSVTSLSATVDGIKSTVATKADQSEVTQLSNLVQSKVSSGDFTSTTTQLKNLINQRVQVGDVISQINQEAGGDTLIQVSNGKKSLILDAGNTIVTGKAWIPVAAIANLTADQVQAGTLKGVKVDFRDSTGTGMIADGSTLTFDVSNTPAGYLSYNGMPVAELPDGSGGNELAIRYRLSTSIIPDDSSGAQATFSKAAQKIAYMIGTNQGRQMLSGLEVHANNHHWLGAVNSDATCNRFEVNDRDGLNIAWHDNTHLWVSDGKAKLYKDTDDGQTATKLEVHGWAWVNGWVEAAGHSQHSTLSSKTRIEEADPNHMLDLVNNTELTTFSFKSEVAEGTEARHIGPIIDDVNDVAQYQMPAEFIAPTKTARDDDNMIGALFGAVQALTKRIKKMEDKLNG